MMGLFNEEKCCWKKYEQGLDTWHERWQRRIKRWKDGKNLMESGATAWQKAVQKNSCWKKVVFLCGICVDRLSWRNYINVTENTPQKIKHLRITMFDARWTGAFRTFLRRSLSFCLVITVFFPPFAQGRPDGVYNKSCCHEKSPSKSSEVISPEILKMRAALFCIFTYLDTKTLLRTAEVCRDWKFVARHPAVWTRVLLENARISSKVCGRTEVLHAISSFQ